MYMCQISFVDITITMRYPLRIKAIPYRMIEQNSTKSPAMDVLQQRDEPLPRLGTVSSRIVYGIFSPENTPCNLLKSKTYPLKIVFFCKMKFPNESPF